MEADALRRSNDVGQIDITVRSNTIAHLDGRVTDMISLVVDQGNIVLNQKRELKVGYLVYGPLVSCVCLLCLSRTHKFLNRFLSLVWRKCARNHNLADAGR